MAKVQKSIEYYTHPGEDKPRTVDPQPGNYYVSVVNGPRFALALGPFPAHQEALDKVDAVRAMAMDRDGFAAFWSYGTVRMRDEYKEPGRWNTALGLPTVG